MTSLTFGLFTHVSKLGPSCGFMFWLLAPCGIYFMYQGILCPTNRHIFRYDLHHQYVRHSVSTSFSIVYLNKY